MQLPYSGVTELHERRGVPVRSGYHGSDHECRGQQPLGRRGVRTLQSLHPLGVLDELPGDPVDQLLPVDAFGAAVELVEGGVDSGPAGDGGTDV